MNDKRAVTVSAEQDRLPRSQAAPAAVPGLLTVREVMRPLPTIEPEAHLAAAEYLIKHLHRSALIVASGDNHEPVATISATEISQALADGRDPEMTRINQVARRNPVTIGVDLAAADAARLMASHGLQRLPVVDGGRLVGAVDLADLSQAAQLYEQFPSAGAP